MRNTYIIIISMLMCLSLATAPVQAGFLNDISNGISKLVSNVTNAIGSFFSNIGKSISNAVSTIINPNKNTNSNSNSNSGTNPSNVDSSKIIGGSSSSSGSSTTIKTTKSKTIQGTIISTGTVSVETSDYASWYDLNLKYSEIKCVGCLDDKLVAGHTFNLYYSIKNYGNTINTQPFKLVGKITTPNKVIPIDYEINYFIAGGAEVMLVEPLSNFGIKPDGKLEDWAIGNSNVSIKFELEIQNDNGIISPMIQKISTPTTITSYNEATYNKCVSGIKISPTLDSSTASKLRKSMEASCKNQATDVTQYTDITFKYSCPDGSSTDNTGKSCKSENVGGVLDIITDKFSTIIQIFQLSPKLIGAGNLNV